MGKSSSLVLKTISCVRIEKGEEGKPKSVQRKFSKKSSDTRWVQIFENSVLRERFYIY